MLFLKAIIRKNIQKIKDNFIPAVLYGPKIENKLLFVERKEFETVYKKAGETSLISLSIKGEDNKEKESKFSVLIQEVQKSPLNNKIIHIDFYQPLLTDEIEVSVPLEFVGESPAVKELGGTLIKEIQEIEVKALPQNIPSKIEVDISKLKTFKDEILVKDLFIPANVKVQRDLEEIVAVVTPPEKEVETEEETTESKEEIETTTSDENDKNNEKEEE